jgi:trimeric autotransporter adhesin
MKFLDKPIWQRVPGPERFEGQDNTVCELDAVIAGGVNNVIDAPSSTAQQSFIGGGSGNVISRDSSFVGAGGLNSISNVDGFVGAGYGNVVSGEGSFIGAGGLLFQYDPGNQISGSDSFVGAGDENTIAANYAFLGSGATNTISSAATYGSLIGGRSNSVSGLYATVIGGYANTASGSYAIVAGGDSDTASGTLTFAAGYHADALHSGSFVWSDYTSGSALIEDTASNEFVARASGGVYLYSNEAASAGVRLAPGSGTWSNLSDRASKADIVPLDDASVLAKVNALPVSTWRYKSERGVRHAGPMAQDFYAAFGVGEDDRHITSIDEDGVALAAIKALSRQIGDLRGEVGTLHGEIGALHGENAALKSRVAGLEKR